MKCNLCTSFICSERAWARRSQDISARTVDDNLEALHFLLEELLDVSQVVVDPCHVLHLPSLVRWQLCISLRCLQQKAPMCEYMFTAAVFWVPRQKAGLTGVSSQTGCEEKQGLGLGDFKAAGFQFHELKPGI